jgi:hypothetical protein
MDTSVRREGVTISKSIYDSSFSSYLAKALRAAQELTFQIRCTTNEREASQSCNSVLLHGAFDKLQKAIKELAGAERMEFAFPAMVTRASASFGNSESAVSRSGELRYAYITGNKKQSSTSGRLLPWACGIYPAVSASLGIATKIRRQDTSTAGVVNYSPSGSFNPFSIFTAFRLWWNRDNTTDCLDTEGIAAPQDDIDDVITAARSSASTKAEVKVARISKEDWTVDTSAVDALLKKWITLDT